MRFATVEMYSAMFANFEKKIWKFWNDREQAIDKASNNRKR